MYYKRRLFTTPSRRSIELPLRRAGRELQLIALSSYHFAALRELHLITLLNYHFVALRGLAAQLRRSLSALRGLHLGAALSKPLAALSTNRYKSLFWRATECCKIKRYFNNTTQAIMQTHSPNTQLREASRIIRQGGIVAYPTEAVFGLGCDPMNGRAVRRLSVLKRRPPHKGYILVGGDFSQLRPFCKPLTTAQWQRVQQSWPGPYTWIFPETPLCPSWLCGDEAGVAVRVSAHPTVIALCARCGHALVSTSANWSGEPPAKDWQTVEKQFEGQVDYIVRAAVSHPEGKPTMIRDAVSGQRIR